MSFWTMMMLFFAIDLFKGSVATETAKKIKQELKLKEHVDSLDNKPVKIEQFSEFTRESIWS